MKKSINIQVVSLLLFVALYIANLLFNWEYYKQYDGIKTTEYIFAIRLELVLRYAILFLWCSIVILSTVRSIGRKRGRVL